MYMVGAVSSYGAWWKWVGGIGLVLVVANVFYFYVPDFDQKWRLFNPILLGAEQNLGAWWSGIVLFAAGALFYELHSRATDGLRTPWLLFAILLTILSVDEIISIHERLNWFQTILLGLPAGAMFIYAIVQLFAAPHTRVAAWLIFFGFLCFGSIGIQEFLEKSLIWPDWAQGIRNGVEEGTELLGSFLVLLGIVDRRGRAGEIGTAGIVPAPEHLRHFPALLLCGLVLHLAAVLFVAPALDNIKRLGHPGSWYPAMVFLLIAASAFGKSAMTRPRHRTLWGVLAVVFVLCSLSAVFFRLSIVMNFVGLPPDSLTNFYFLYAWGMAAVLAAFAAAGYRSKRHCALIAAMALVIAMEIGFIGWAMPQLALGLFAYFCALFFLFDQSPESTESSA